jgi:phosphatidylglycerol:prolipoprotein diacylglycerol transferase
LIPYLPHPTVDLGFYTVEAFPVFVGAAIIAQFQIVMRRAPLFGIEPKTASSLLGFAIFFGIVGAHVFDVVVYFPEKVLANPLILFEVWGTLSSFGGMLFGLGGLYLVMRRWRMPAADMLRFVDCLIFALPFTLAIGRAGCALKHDHLGAASQHWLAVDFPGAARFDLGVLEFLYMIPIVLLFVWLGRRPQPSGVYIGLFFALYGPVRFLLDALRVDDARYAGWTPGQYLSIVATIVGAAVLTIVLRRREPPAPQPA